MNKLDIFETTVVAIDPDIIGVTESWTNEKITDAELLLPGYELFHCDRKTNNVGGGVLLYIKAELKPIEFSMMTKYPEHAWCKVRGSNNQELLIGVLYRSDNPNIYPDGCHGILLDLLTEVSNQHTLILGDFNCSNIDWTSHTLLPSAGETVKSLWSSWRINSTHSTSQSQLEGIQFSIS